MAGRQTQNLKGWERSGKTRDIRPFTQILERDSFWEREFLIAFCIANHKRNLHFLKKKNFCIDIGINKAFRVFYIRKVCFRAFVPR